MFSFCRENEHLKATRPLPTQARAAFRPGSLRQGIVEWFGAGPFNPRTVNTWHGCVTVSSSYRVQISQSQATKTADTTGADVLAELGCALQDIFPGHNQLLTSNFRGGPRKLQVNEVYIAGKRVPIFQGRNNTHALHTSMLDERPSGWGRGEASRDSFPPSTLDNTTAVEGEVPA